MCDLMIENTVPVIPYEELKRVWHKSPTKKQYTLESLAKIEYKRRPEFKHRAHFVRSKTEDETEGWGKYFMDPKDSEIWE